MLQQSQLITLLAPEIYELVKMEAAVEVVVELGDRLLLVVNSLLLVGIDRQGEAARVRHRPRALPVSSVALAPPSLTTASHMAYVAGGVGVSHHLNHRFRNSNATCRPSMQSTVVGYVLRRS